MFGNKYVKVMQSGVATMYSTGLAYGVPLTLVYGKPIGAGHVHSYSGLVGVHPRLRFALLFQLTQFKCPSLSLFVRFTFSPLRKKKKKKTSFIILKFLSFLRKGTLKLFKKSQFKVFIFQKVSILIFFFF
jgi:hypothetical protein